VAILAEQLQLAGHVVDLIAAGGSSTYGGKLYVHYHPTLSRLDRVRRKLQFQALSLRAASSADVIINFGRIDYLEGILRTTKTLVVCFQNPVSQKEIDWLTKRRKHRLAIVGVSHAQIRGLQPPGIFSVIYNVADTNFLKFSTEPSTPPYLVFLGRITENKGADTAIRVALLSGMPLKLAGNISDEAGGKEFFESEVRPHLGSQIEWVGPVNDVEKQTLLAGASALLFPIRWEEPFGIVMVESLACGTPVVATRCASTPEVVTPGETGFLCDSEEDFLDAITQISKIDRNVCRGVAETRFSPRSLLDGYLSTIRSVLPPSLVEHHLPLSTHEQPKVTRKLRILVIADPHLPVPPQHYGGTERVAGLVCQQLQTLGHTVDLIGAKGSTCYGGQLSFHESPSRTLISRAHRKLSFQWKSLRAARGVDAVLNFGRIDYLEGILKTRVPVICRFGNPLSQSEVTWLRARRKRALRIIGVSHSQVEGLVPKEIIHVVHNATDVDEYPPRLEPLSPPYLAFLGRLTPNKGADIAIAVAKRAGLPLKLAGNIPNEKGAAEFFNKAIEPELNAQIQYVGPVNNQQKHDLLGGATALLFPITWNEPFAGVAVESLACGTPVIAFRRASTPEAIIDGKTGFLCDDEDEMVAAVRRVGTLNRMDCRQAAEESFSGPVIAKAYLDVILSAIADRP
jgi:glycosyltransferase involved in cell wall biosynthesis